jgi:hypothetical protein
MADAAGHGTSAGPDLPMALSWPDSPVVYEVNTAVWLGEVAGRVGADVTLGSVPASEWDLVVPDGISVVWLMGVWARSPRGREIALSNPDLRASWSSALPDWTEADVVGSPYCITDYVPAAAFGGWAGLDSARAQLRARGALLMVDWVPNHVGPDSPWLRSAPDAFVRGAAEDLTRSPEAFVDVDGRVFAKGKDPYFAPWPDVVQVDAFAPSLRSVASRALGRIAEHADAVRCDMAMLMLDDVVSAIWGERVGPPPAVTYWTEMIAAARAVNPAFRFVAEAYWDREWDLQQLGFDYCYDKRLYDRLAQGDVAPVRGHLDADPTYQRRLVRFLENHDEPRATRTFAPPARVQAAAVTVATLPGLTLWHDGQAEGRQVFVPVFLGRRADEPRNPALATWYHHVWAAAPCVRAGAWARREVTGWPDNASAEALVAWSWTQGEAVSLVVVNLTDQPADGVVHVGHTVAAGSRWTLDDLLDGARYVRSGDDLADGGLYVALAGWGAHVFTAAAMPDGASLDDAATGATT